MNKQQIPSFTFVLYYIILAIVVTGVVWAYVMPVEVTILGKGYINFLGAPQALCVPEDGIVEAIALKSMGEVQDKQKILDYGRLGQDSITNGKKELLSPYEGTLIWQRELIRGDMLKMGERVALIYPSYPIGVKAYLSEQDLSRVQPQMPVRVKLGAYPFQNYGVIEGRVKELVTQRSSMPGQEMEVVALIELEEPIDKRIILRPGLAADVEIITGKTRLLNKLLF